MKKVIEGSHAIAEAASLAKVQVIAAYPITPQTHIVEALSENCSDGTLDARFINVESEHSAMAAVIGAASGGARTFTATSSHGLAYMHELLHWASAARLPIVMAEVNRALGPGWNIWTDQTDSLAQRDTGWIQLYCEDGQEALDTTLQAFRLAEAVNLPPGDGGPLFTTPRPPLPVGHGRSLCRQPVGDPRSLYGNALQHPARHGGSPAPPGADRKRI
jgi:pyruvate/2-oxoacid:ferredoxin oxidoreductase alpha subunit